MPPIAGASQAVPAVPLPSSNPLYATVVANPNAAQWGPILAMMNPPYTMPDLPLASGAVGPLSTKDQWKADNRDSYVLKDPIDLELILQDGMSAEQVQMTIFKYNLRQYISIKAAALAAAEIAWRTANNFAAYNRIAWASANVDMNIFDTRGAYVYETGHDVTTKDILQRLVLMEARILSGAGIPAAAPVAPAPGQPPVAAPVGMSNPNAMMQPIMAAINTGFAPFSTLINKVGAAVTKVSKALDASTATITGAITDGVTGLSDKIDTIVPANSSANNATAGGGRRSRRKSRA